MTSGRHERDLDFFSLDLAPGATTGVMRVSPRLASSLGPLYGGAAAGAAVVAMEHATGRDLVWVTVQFVGTAVPGEVMSIDADVLAVGRGVSQVRVRGAVGDREVFSALGAVGVVPPDSPQEHSLVMPAVAGPDECPEWTDPWAAPPPGHAESFMGLREIRRPEVLHAEADNQALVWCRVLGHEQTSAATLGWMADALVLPVFKRFGRHIRASSLDNTLRMAATATTDWVLLDARILGSLGAFTYGSVHLWSRDGTLLGTGSQTLRLRP
ncbi:MAG: hypothetical protein JWL64_1926 [Frankiales bacterium]|nr:hypothetical protein [Frankiales bacterium]